jgi:hypothetical protein
MNMNISMNLDHHHFIYYSLLLSLHFMMSPYYFPLSFQSSCPFIPCSHPIKPLHSQPSLAITLSILPFPSSPSFITPSSLHYPLSSPLLLGDDLLSFEPNHQNNSFWFKTFIKTFKSKHPTSQCLILKCL